MTTMELKFLDHDLTICKVPDAACIDLASSFYFVGRTDEELSLVCRTEDTPARTIACEDGWRAFRIQGVLDFSLVGILAPIAQLLAEHRIGIFAVSTFNTDYILVKKVNLDLTRQVLADAGYTIV